MRKGRVLVGEIGEMVSGDVWNSLVENSASQLIDVRTSAEWAFVGVPDLSSINREVLYLEWAIFPDMARNPEFEDSLLGFLEQHNLIGDGDLFFLCRSGVRSRAAAKVIADRMDQKFTGRCINISDGFEGDRDSEGHRNIIGGWRAAKLPWKQG